MHFLKQKISGLKKRLRSFSFGIAYWKDADFVVPTLLKVNGKQKQFKFNNTADSNFVYEFTEICLNDCYRLSALKKELGAVQTIVDIGANQGLFILAARQHFSKASISCYEPNLLLENILDNNARQLNATVYYEAVAKENCTMNLQFGASDLHTIAKPASLGQITGTAFKKVVERAGGKIDILKIDCEGGEWTLLDDKNTWAAICSVTMEYHLWAKAGSKADDVIMIIEGLGFRVISNERLSENFGLITGIKKS